MTISTPHQYPVRLTSEQRQELKAICTTGSSKVRRIKRARVLLLSDHGRPGGKLTRQEVADRVDLHVNSVDRIRKAFFLEGHRPVLDRKPHASPRRAIVLDGEKEAKLLAMCCGPAPEGHVRWTLTLLTDQLIARRIVTTISTETVRRTLKKTNSSLGVRSAGASRKRIRRGL